ncbi:MAG: cation-transporting P-type ATPase, partial [Candidatus Heimdallarchaeaceae archaeon]
MKKGTKSDEKIVQKYFIPHNRTIEEICKELDTDVRFGLKKEEADARLINYGENVLPKIKGSVWDVYIAPLLNWLINIYLIVSILMVILGLIKAF